MITIDEKITDLFKVVRLQKYEVEQAEKESKASWLTNCSISFDGKTEPFNIQTATMETIRKIVIMLLQYDAFSRQADSLLAIPHEPKYQNFLINDWIADCKKRVTIVELKSKKDNLTQLEKRLNAIVSPEQKRQMELDEITKSLGI